MVVDQGPAAGGDAAPVPASAQPDEQMGMTVPVPSVSRVGVTEVSVEASPEDDPHTGSDVPGALGELLTSSELSYGTHPAFQTLPATAPPLASSTTVESYEFVGTSEELGSVTLLDPTAVASLPAVDEDVAPTTDPGTDSAAADPAGGGNAPDGSGGGAGAVAKAMAARATVILTLGSLPSRSNALSLTTTPAAPVERTFDLSDPGAQALLYCTWIFVGFIITAGIAYFVKCTNFSVRGSRVATFWPPLLLVESHVISSTDSATGVAETPPGDQ